jgi:hypothetical protein
VKKDINEKIVVADLKKCGKGMVAIWGLFAEGRLIVDDGFGLAAAC